MEIHWKPHQALYWLNWTLYPQTILFHLSVCHLYSCIRPGMTWNKRTNNRGTFSLLCCCPKLYDKTFNTQWMCYSTLLYSTTPYTRGGSVLLHIHIIQLRGESISTLSLSNRPLLGASQNGLETGRRLNWDINSFCCCCCPLWAFHDDGVAFYENFNFYEINNVWSVCVCTYTRSIVFILWSARFLSFLVLCLLLPGNFLLLRFH